MTGQNLCSRVVIVAGERVRVGTSGKGRRQMFGDAAGMVARKSDALVVQDFVQKDGVRRGTRDGEFVQRLSRFEKFFNVSGSPLDFGERGRKFQKRGEGRRFSGID